jgi:MSHA biogenesis protein MshL
MRLLRGVVIAFLIGGCAAPPPRPVGIEPELRGEVDKALAQQRQAPRATFPEEALLPPLRMEMPAVDGKPIDQRFDLSVSSAPAAQVFMALVSGTRYSMLVHPSVSGTISVNLKDVTIEEAMFAMRELYGYEYKIDGTRIFVSPAGLQTRVFQVNYLPGQRRGTSSLRVVSGAISDAGAAGASVPGIPGAGAAAATAPAGSAAGGAGGAAGRLSESSRVQMDQFADFWTELRESLQVIVGSAGGRSVVVSPQSGVVVVRAFPPEIRAVEEYLRASRFSIERQVMLEAKFVEVTLSDDYQAGINWAAFRNSGPDATVGQLSQGGRAPTALGTRPQTLTGDAFAVNQAARAIGSVAGITGSLNPAAAVFGLALQTSNFAALLSFLQSQGSVQVLSSPRVATLNNQKAILKVGIDDFFVTNFQPAATTAAAGVATTTGAAVSFSPFFSGIVLDVTPRIDEGGNIILHIHPAVTDVTENIRNFNVGGGPVSVPFARSSVSETDTIVRVQDGNIVAIGGLMSVDVRDSRGGIPGVSEGGVGNLLRNANRAVRKRELVILIKPTVIHSDRNWEQDLRETGERFRSIDATAPAAPPGTRPR